MSDEMKVQPFRTLLDWILREYEENGSIFGIDRSLFFTPQENKPYAVQDMFGSYLATPIGPAAGPHTQLTQNILAAWLSGGRFIELKTVQIMDELEIPRPCIDMEDEGYNVEFSQELKLAQSVNEYIKAWVLIFVLRRLLGFEGKVPFGTIFNMSVGYDLAGIQSEPMVNFMNKLKDASAEIAELMEILKNEYPQFADIEVPTQLTNNVTLSTMHGCPPDEIEKIARYLIEERGLHTTVKMNPTLLGKEKVLNILHDQLGFHEIIIPDSVFEADLKYERAVALIKSLQESAEKHGVEFGVKLSNTLAMENHKDALPGEEMYMSGRALYPITVNLFDKLLHEFDGKLKVSYSAGADAFNVDTLAAAGALPITAASDILKPGGYSRFVQYIENLEDAMNKAGADSLQAFAARRLDVIKEAAAEALTSPRYKKDYHPFGLPKVGSGLDFFDCVEAPCMEPCAVHQDVPEYAWLIAQGQYDRALEVILARNPLPGITGYICTHLCQTRCTRNNYDDPVAIRALKRFAVEKGKLEIPAARKTDRKVAIIGGGPSGLAAASFLSLNGVQTTIFEAKDRAGGMASIAPRFRIPEEVVLEDVERVVGLGADLRLSSAVDKAPAELLKEGYDAVYIAAGFQKDASLDIEGIESQGVFTSLDLLERVAKGEKVELGSGVLVIGGGNTAMDAARTAQRLTGEPVTIVYRRTRAEMPAEDEEIVDLLEEGNQIRELLSPEKVVVKGGKVAGLVCVQNELGEPGPDGRRRPVPVPGSQFELQADSIILAIGQQPDLTFLQGGSMDTRRNGALVAEEETGRVDDCVFAGGDVVQGPATIISACADGRRAAEAICQQFGIDFSQLHARPHELTEEQILEVKRTRTRKQPVYKAEMLPVKQRGGFELIEQTFSEETARLEASRCMQCSTFCDKCVEVCPNRANYLYRIEPVSLSLPVLACQNGSLTVVGSEDFCVQQTRQIVHIDDLCNECGNCATFCVHQGKPYLEKPRLFLNEQYFEEEESNAFFIQNSSIRRREGGQEARLDLDNGSLVYEDQHVRLSLNINFDVKEMTLKESFEGQLSLKPAAEMALVHQGVTATADFLLV